MPRLKRLAVESIGRALQRAERYRLLGEPCEAESISEDVLEVDPGNHEALVMLILALTDQFRSDLSRVTEARGLTARLPEGYERFYYAGLVTERLAKAELQRSGPGGDSDAARALREAMSWYEKAEAVRPPANDDAILRWNACARMIRRRGLTDPSDETARIAQAKPARPAGGADAGVKRLSTRGLAPRGPRRRHATGS